MNKPSRPKHARTVSADISSGDVTPKVSNFARKNLDTTQIESIESDADSSVFSGMTASVNMNLDRDACDTFGVFVKKTVSESVSFWQ